MVNSVNDKYFQEYKARMEASHAQSAHDFHIMEFEEMCKDMISKALEAHDQEVQVDVQTTLNGQNCTLNGLVNDIKKQIQEKLRKAFK